MPKNIKPLNDNWSAPDAIPDRSKLSEIYARPVIKLEPKKIASGKNTQATIGLYDGLVLNALIIIPYIITFVSIHTIYSMNYSAAFAFQGRLNMTLLTALIMLSLYVALRFISRFLSKHLINPSYIVLSYTFFIFPIIEISIKLIDKGWQEIVIFLCTSVISQIYIWCLLDLYQANKVTAPKVVAPVGIVLAIVCLAIFI